MLKNIGKNLPGALALGAGAIAGGYVSKLLPIGNDKIKAAAPVVVGLLLSGQKGMVAKLGEGMIAGGFANLAKSFGIGTTEFPLLAGLGEQPKVVIVETPSREGGILGDDANGEMNY